MSSRRTTSRQLRCSGAAFALASALLAAPAAGSATPADDARAAMEETLNRAMAVLRDKSLALPERRARVEKIVEERFDFGSTARLVLARNWRKLSEAARDEFVVEFRRHLNVTYGRRLGTISEERIDFGDTRTEKNGDVTVRTRVTGGAAGEGVSIDYRLRKRDGAWRAIDVIIEGVSLLSNFRSQVQEIISTHGADALISRLREKNDRAEATEES